LELAMGAPCLEETIAGFKLQLPPMKYLWNCVHGAEMICKAVEELLAPSNKMTVLEVGCDSGLIGLYLSKVRMKCHEYACSTCLF
jgi:tRNA/tmRNA/rRNA uracil-C5-methylase (TrmA/RlmC/RlmD family)